MVRHLHRIAPAAVLAAFVLLVPSASAVVSEVNTGSGTITIGAQPRSVTLRDGLQAAAKSFDNAAGHPVMHSDATYAIYWDPNYDYHGDWEHLIDTFLQGAGNNDVTRDTVFSIDQQYADATNTRTNYSATFRGAYRDTNAYPVSGCTDPDTLGGYLDPAKQLDNVACLTDQQIREELQIFITENKLPTGMATSFILLTPPGVTVCADTGGTLTSHCSDTLGSANSFCSYHSAISLTNPVEGDAKTVLYAMIPWSAGGEGDYHLWDESPGYECQDGGFDPSSEPIEKKEQPKPRTEKEQEEFEKLLPEEKQTKEEAEEKEGPHQQEPNQIGLGPDGTFDTGLADLIVNQVAVEEQNMLTDPLLNAWQDSSGNEMTDECRNFFAYSLGGSSAWTEKTDAGTLYNQEFTPEERYYLNDAFNLAALKQGYPGIACLPGIQIVPQFTSPDPVNTGDLVGFDAGESDITLDAGEGFTAGVPHAVYPTYTWNFGDGVQTTPTGAPGQSPVDLPSVFHSYQYGGTYTVTLTVTDVGGNIAKVSAPIMVVGPPAPSTGVTAQGSPGPQTVAPASSVSKSQGIPAPVITDFVESKSVKSALHSGLAVRYTVNEQVAGSLQVILDSTTAKRLHLQGPLASGLPAGTPRSIVIGTAVLVTTKAGAGTIRIKFSSRTALRLKNVRKLTLTVRVLAHNASRQSPATTTVLSTAVLK